VGSTRDARYETLPADLAYLSIVAMLASSWRAPAAGVRVSSRAIWTSLSSTASAAVFSSTRATRRV